MKKINLRSGKLFLRIMLLLMIVAFNQVAAQTTTYTFTGNVTDGTTGIPIAGASVFLEGTTNGGVTDFDGDYSFNASLSLGNKTVVASYLGYSTKKVQVTLGSIANIATDIALSEDLLSLDEVIVTGNTVGVNKRTLGNAISTVKAEDLVNNGATAVDQAISGKITGALVQQNSGDPAGGISIRLRGPSTITGSSDPLYIVDGIIISNSSNQLIDLGGNAQNRLADINPNDVERIEIIKGAAAAAIYGSRASNGVVQIFTKKGKTGEPKFNFSSNVRINELRKQIKYNNVPLAWVDPADRGNLATTPITRYNLQDSFFGAGYGLENNLSVSGGNEGTTYYLSATQLDNEGIIVNSDFNRIGFKANVTQKASDWLDITAGFNYVRSTSNDIPNGGINSAYGAITGFLFADNSINPLPNESGVYPNTSSIPTVPRTNPLEAVNRFDFGQKVNRFITSVGLNANITDKLSASYTLGIDYFNQSATAFIPLNNTSTNPNGFARRSDINNFQYNSDLNLTYKTPITDDINSTTTIGGSWQYEEFDRIGITADGLPPIVETAESGSVLAQGESRSQISYWGSFVQQTFGYKEKLYINGALRVDGASTFGNDQRNQLYAKASLSYIVSEEEFWKNTFGETFNVFKLRGSWGQAGNLTALSAFQRFTLLEPGAIGGLPSLTPSTRRGSFNIAPERQEEFEFGVDAGFFNSRLGRLYYKQEVTDLLLPRELAPSTGFGSRIENIGNL